MALTFLALLLALVPTELWAQTASAKIVPDVFLRRWDPLTIFFERELGPAAANTPEDAPERFVKLEPSQPGAFTWLDARTLQFRPADPWPALSRVKVEVVGAKTFTLATLMSPPQRTEPAAGATGLDEVKSLVLTFAEALEPEALARGLAIELRPLPGVGAARQRFLDHRDFSIKVLDRAKPTDSASYIVSFKEPLPLGHRVLATLQLALAGLGEQKTPTRQPILEFSTAEPFRVLAVGCGGAMLPITPEGSRYAEEQAVRCAAEEATAIRVELSSAPLPFDIVELRNLLRLTPFVANLKLAVKGRTLEVGGDFARDTSYRVDLAPAAIADGRGRPLEVAAGSRLFLHFPPRQAFVQVARGQGLAERFGPQRLPLTGRGDEQIDVRIHRIDPLDRNFWPFPEAPVLVDEGSRPPGPGEEPPAASDSRAQPSPSLLGQRIRALGSPDLSTLQTLPLTRHGNGASFGLDLAAQLRRLNGRADAPGTYLVGLRRLDGGEQRSWMRLQVTDLSLTTVEEASRVVFVVTSLKNAKPLAGAQVTVEGSLSGSPWHEYFSGVTDESGRLVWTAPGSQGNNLQIRRILVRKDDDVLTLSTLKAPQVFFDGTWSESWETWLQWAFADLRYRGPQALRLGHLFTERPVYRPEDVVHVKGYFRERSRGRLRPLEDGGLLVIDGPGDQRWQFPVTLDDYGSFYHRFDVADTPSGTYRAHFEFGTGGGEQLGEVYFRKEAYKLPRFQVDLTGPDKNITSLDREFKVQLNAAYYAGGRVAQRPIAWRVTQFPHSASPRPRDGFIYSSDGRFSRTETFRQAPTLERQDTTDDNGGALLWLNPALEPTAQPRIYVVEATVTDIDDATVTATERVVALPPFWLGLKVPRFLEAGQTLEPEILAVGPDDLPLAGQKIKVRLKHRQWHSHLQASDFTDGVARYITDVVDELVLEKEVVSQKDGLRLPLTVPESGVYVVEIEAHDRLGRAQVVAVDLFAAGSEQVAWPKPTSAVFEISTDKKVYQPGDRARLVFHSPFQEARALVVVEAPDANEYHWVDVSAGQGIFELAIEGHFAPKRPVHVLLMRGRLEGIAPLAGNAADLGKPATLGATKWIEVAPIAHQLELALDFPRQAQPGKEIEIAIELKTPDGQPSAGQVTLWLVDQAVLALGREQRLDPVPDFVPADSAFTSLRDTRSLVFGELPFAEMPGGGQGEDGGLFDRQTVRKNFVAVPYFEPDLRVGPDGKLKVKVQLPDDLTNFAVRAKAAALPERFGFATGTIEVRLPLIVQPALPRFARPGDSFTASAIGRLVSGAGGPGTSEARFAGVELKSEAKKDVAWIADRPERLDYQVEVPTENTETAATFRVAVERAVDGAGDAFEVKIPIIEDRRPVKKRQIVELARGKSFDWPGPAEAFRPGSLERSIFFSERPDLVRMAGALDALFEYPYGCTEQRLSRAGTFLAYESFREKLGLDAVADARAQVEETLAWLPLVVTNDGLCAYWPGSTGYVSLTAWALDFLVGAERAGFVVDAKLRAKLERALGQALRSDYPFLIDGSAYAERTMALQALANAGKFEGAYAAELSRRVELSGPEDVARLLKTWKLSGKAATPEAALLETLWRSVNFRLFQGQEIYGGLKDQPRSPLILPSETRSLATIVEALALSDGEAPRLEPLIDALVRLGREDGWGSTQANAAAFQALAAALGQGGDGKKAVEIAWSGERQQLAFEESARRIKSADPGNAKITWSSGGERLIARLETSYVPAEGGDRQGSERAGFVVERELIAISNSGAAPEMFRLDVPRELSFRVGQVIEEHIRVISSGERHFVAVFVPLAAGFEPLNPRLQTAPPEAKPSGVISTEPTYADYRDDHVAFYFNSLPSGTHDFYFRVRATTAGSFTLPPARAELMYEAAVFGRSPGARVVVDR